MLGALGPREARRALLETLADPDVEDTAKEMFNQFDVDRTNGIEVRELMNVLTMLHDKLGLQQPNGDSVEKLFKRYDLDTDGTLGFFRILRSIYC